MILETWRAHLKILLSAANFNHNNKSNVCHKGKNTPAFLIFIEIASVCRGSTLQKQILSSAEQGHIDIKRAIAKNGCLTLSFSDVERRPNLGYGCVQACNCNKASILIFSDTNQKSDLMDKF